MRRTVRILTTVAAASSVGLTLTAPPASADDLNQQRIRVTQELAQTQQDLGESNQQLSSAAIAVSEAQRRLASAGAQLAQTRRYLVAAQARDTEMAAKLQQAKAALAQAKAAVLAGERSLAAERALAGEMVRDQYQQQTNLLPIAILVQSNSMADLQTRLQWSTTMFDTTQAHIDRLRALQRQLTAERVRQAALEKDVAADRAVAAENLMTKTTLERQAFVETASVASLVRLRTAAQAQAKRAVAADQARYAGLDKERASVEHRIAVRIAKAKAEAARRAAAAARAAKIAAYRAAVTRQRAQARSARASRQSSSQSGGNRTRTGKKSRTGSWSGGSSSGAHHGFIFPVVGPITSPYGMRYHPILHYWKLHDGTDFGASCGTAIHAAQSGRVAERYYNRAYGNRLMIDHGVIDGRYVTTGYNHAIRYVVHVGQHVREGQVIGYVGETGYATGCHLHLMVWLDGHRINPMNWF